MFRFIKLSALAVAAISFAPAHSAPKNNPVTLSGIIDALQSAKCYQASVQFNVTMPQLNDDVVYKLDLYQTSAPTDTLLPCTYLIDWAMTSRDEPVRGFTAYFDGNHYRYSGERVQEYHVKWDADPFTMGSTNPLAPKGVQRTAQFANLLPATIAEELEKMSGNKMYDITLHQDTVISGRRCVAVEAVMRLNGSTAMEATYAFAHDNLMPLNIEFENNPGAVSEQTVTVDYYDTRLDSKCEPVSDVTLMKKYASVFENFRESNFRIENLPGTRLPGFALPTTTGERYARRTADAFAVPTIVAILDASHAYNQQIVASLRQAVDNIPYNADLIMAFTDNHVDAIEEIVPEMRPGEHLLMSAKPLARDCGAASLPAIILTDANAVVRNVIIGFNNDLAADVIQKMALVSESTPSRKTGGISADENETTTNTSITSMETVHFKDQPVHTYGSLPQVGTAAPSFNLTGASLAPVKLEDFKGKTVVLNIFPSLDTEVCARSVRRFNEEASKLPETAVVCVSQDLPFAMSRFCSLEGLENVIPASAFRSPQFGEKYGVMLVDGPLAGLLTRAVVIIGPDGTVKYRELVPEITSEPDYDAALRVLKGKY